jgi:hypothetical protein
MRRNRWALVVSVLGFGFSTIAATALAAVTVAKEGKYENVGCYTSTMQTNAPVKGQMGGSYEGLGTTITKEGDVFNNTSGRCLGTFTMVGEEYNEMGSCSFTDADGDSFFGLYSRKNKEIGSWKVTGGTGKYEGMQLSGTWMPYTQITAPAGHAQSCNKQSGSWKLR